MVQATEWTTFNQATDWPAGNYDYWTDSNFNWITPDGTAVTEVMILLPDVGSTGLTAYSVGTSWGSGDVGGSSSGKDPGLYFNSPGIYFIRIKYNGGNGTYKCVVGAGGASPATDDINPGSNYVQSLYLANGGGESIQGAPLNTQADVIAVHHTSAGDCLDLYPIWQQIKTDWNRSWTLNSFNSVGDLAGSVTNAYSGTKLKVWFLGHGRENEGSPPGGDMRVDDSVTPYKRITYGQNVPCQESATYTLFRNNVYVTDGTARIDELRHLTCFFAQNLNDSCHSMKKAVSGSGAVVYGYKGCTFHTPRSSSRYAHYGIEKGAAFQSYTLP